MTKRLAGLASLLTLGSLAIAPAASAAPKSLELEFLGRTPAGGEATAEIAALNPATATVYATNAAANSLDLYDFSDPTAPTVGESIDLDPYGGGPNSVAFSPRKGGIVAVAVEADEKTEPGTVELFDGDGSHLRTISAGALPDMLTFAKGGRLLLVANEGEPADDGSVDPPGSVTIVNLKKFGQPKTGTAGLGSTKLRGLVRIYTSCRASNRP
jgi:DNA-binding beta-propeller fold protein YncE